MVEKVSEAIAQVEASHLWGFTVGVFLNPCGHPLPALQAFLDGEGRAVRFALLPGFALSRLFQGLEKAVRRLENAYPLLSLDPFREVTALGHVFEQVLEIFVADPFDFGAAQFPEMIQQCGWEMALCKKEKVKVRKAVPVKLGFDTVGRCDLIKPALPHHAMPQTVKDLADPVPGFLVCFFRVAVALRVHGQGQEKASFDVRQPWQQVLKHLVNALLMKPGLGHILLDDANCPAHLLPPFLTGGSPPPPEPLALPTTIPSP